MIGAIVSAVPAIISGISAISAQNRASRLLASLDFEMPESMKLAEKQKALMASGGIPNKDKIADLLKSTLPSSINSIKDAADNPMSIIGATQTAEGAVNEKLYRLMLDDAQAKVANMKEYSDFQSGPIASWQATKSEFERQRSTGMLKHNMEGTRQFMQALTSGVQTGFSTYSNMEKNKYLQDYYSSLLNMYKGYAVGGKTGGGGSGGFSISPEDIQDYGGTGVNNFGPEYNLDSIT